jgi:hypothetical protein
MNIISMSEPRPNNERHSDGKVPLRIDPNSHECRAKPSGFGDYVDCLVDACKRCRYALEFGSSALCRHPLRHQIVLRTEVGPYADRLNPRD